MKLRENWREKSCGSLNDRRVVKLILHLLKIRASGSYFLLGVVQLAGIEEAAGMSTDASENSFDIEQVLHTALCLAKHIIINGIGAGGEGDSNSNGGKYAKHQDTQQNIRHQLIVF